MDKWCLIHTVHLRMVMRLDVRLMCDKLLHLKAIFFTARYFSKSCICKATTRFVEVTKK